MLSFVGNVKALFKLNEEDESMEKAWGWEWGNVECQLQKEGTCDRVKKRRKKKEWDALHLHPFMTILTSSS